MRHATVISLVSFIACGAFAGQVFAAPQSTDATVRTKALLTTAPDPTVSNSILTPDSKFTFTAGPDGKEAKAQIARQSGGFTTSLSFKGKLAESGDTALLGLTGLSTGASGAVAVSYSRWNPTVNEDRAFAVCDAYTSRRLEKTRVEINGDRSLAVSEDGHWSVNVSGDHGRVTWEFDDGVKDYDRTDVTHGFAKAGVHQVKVTVARDDGVSSVRSWLVAVNKGAAPAETSFAVVPKGTKSKAIARPIQFQLSAPAGKTALVDYGDGTTEKAAMGISGSQPELVKEKYVEAGAYMVSAGIEVADDQFAIVSSPVRVLDDCAISEMGSEPDLQREHALAVDWRLPLIVGASYEMGRSSYEFVDAKTGVAQPAAIRTPIAASGMIGTIFGNGTALAVSVERQRSYRAGKSAQLCEDFGAGFKKCSDAVLGGPSTRDATIATIGLQRNGEHVGIQPKVSYRWSKSGATTSVDVPIYILQNKNGGLNGGVNLGWRTKDGVRAVLFVGVMSDLFGK